MVRTLGKLALALGVAAVLTAPARAQQRGGFGMMGGPTALLTNKGVQKELKLSDEQTEKVTKIAADYRGKMQEKMQDIPQEERREKMPAIMRELNTEVKGQLKDVLKPEQMARFEQISLQTQGANALADPEVAGKLKLTDDQKGKIKEINDDSRSQMREIFQSAGGDREEMQKKMAELRKDTNDKVMGVLTDSQKKTWKEMTGAPFEFRPEPRRQGGGQ